MLTDDTNRAILGNVTIQVVPTNLQTMQMAPPCGQIDQIRILVQFTKFARFLKLQSQQCVCDVPLAMLMFQADALEWATVLIPGDQDHFQAGRGRPVLVMAY